MVPQVKMLPKYAYLGSIFAYPIENVRKKAFVFLAALNLRTLTPCPYVELEAPLHTRVYTTVPCTQG